MTGEPIFLRTTIAVISIGIEKIIIANAETKKSNKRFNVITHFSYIYTSIKYVSGFSGSNISFTHIIVTISVSPKFSIL